MGHVTRNEQELMHAIYAFAADLLRQGRSSREIEAELGSKGLDASSASTVVANLIDMRHAALRKAATKNMVFEAMWCLGGLAVTIATYVGAAQSREGGHVLIAWGAVLLGALQLGHGIMQRMKGVNELV